MRSRSYSSREALVAGAVAAVVGGAPSTLWALAAGDDPLRATLAAGSVVLPHESRRGRLFAAAIPVHLALSLGWAVVLARILPRRHQVAAGALGGLSIAAFDLGVIGRFFPRVRTLPLLPQLADHVAYGATVGYVLARRRRANAAQETGTSSTSPGATSRRWSRASPRAAGTPRTSGRNT